MDVVLEGLYRGFIGVEKCGLGGYRLLPQMVTISSLWRQSWGSIPRFL